jgi:putative nucleotidyltransferase with HDIG domain
MQQTVEWAQGVAEQLLAEELPRRWAHTQGVARQARALADQLGDDADLVEAAAWLHDIGYASSVSFTGFHPLDGARYLRDVQGADDLLCRLVANHSGATFEAEERELAGQLAMEFSLADRHLHLLDAVTACDLATSPDGKPESAKTRVAEILRRYPPDNVVHRAVSRSGASLIETSHRVLGGCAA